MAGKFHGILLFLGLALGLAGVGAPSAMARTPYAESELRAVETQDEAKIRQLRGEEITQLRIALGRRSPTNRRADLYLRLAEIYIEAYRADYLLEGRVHDRRLERNQEDKFIDHTHSAPHLAAGIKACKEILGFRIPFKKLDEVYYFLGFNYSELSDRKQGTKYFELLTRQFPSSPYVSEAYKELGDSAFDDGNFRKAQGYYEQSSRRGTEETMPRIYHKLAWSYYRTKQYVRAVETMKLAISTSLKSGEKFLSLREEALRDMAIFMTETGRVEEAISYFQSVAPDKQFYPRVLEKLGKQYERNVEPAKATQVYESLLKTNPESEAGFRVLVKLVDLDLRRARFKEALARLNGVKLYKGSDNDTAVAAQNLRAMVRRTATENHEKFRKSGRRPNLELAENYYTTYLNVFLASDDSRRETSEIQMYLAEIKRELGKSQEASELYRKVVDSKDKRYAQEAGALWTASLSDAIRKAGKTGGVNTKALEPSPLEIEFIDAADRLQEALGESNDARESALKAAEVYAGYKNTQKKAIKRIKKIIGRWPKSSQSITAARLWLQLQVDADDVDDLKDLMKDLRENEVLMAADREAGGKLKAQLADQETRLKIGQIAKEEKSGDFISAGKSYESFAHDSVQMDLAEKAYGNAISSYLKSKDAVAVSRVSQEWLKRFAKSPRAIEAIRGAASHLLVMGEFAQTAALFASLGRDAGDADSLETAARIYEANGDLLKAQQLWTRYLESYVKHPHRAGVALALGRVQDAGHQDAQAVAAYKNCMATTSELAAECGARLGDLYLRSQNIAEAKVIYRKVGASRSGSPYIGYVRYRLAELMESEAKFDRMEMPEARLKKGLNQRLEFLEPLSRAYTSAVEAGGPWAIAALERLASWVMNFADEVDNIAPPQGADSAAIARFRKNLTSVSDPLRKKAVTTWADGYSKAVAAEALSPALPLLADRLADARAVRPGRAQGARSKLRLGGIASDGGEAGKSTAMEKVRERLGANMQDAGAWVDYGNLLWGDAKPLFAKIAYDRALFLNPRNPAALNNRGVVLMSSEGQESWFTAGEGAMLFKDALKQDDFFLPAKMNRASLLNYFRLFDKSKTLWDQILVKAPGADAYDGLSIALQGLGQDAQAELGFRKATEAGASDSRFVRLYHEAARISGKGVEGAEKCLSLLEDLDSAALSGFEKEAGDRLKKTCTAWKGEGKSK